MGDDLLSTYRRLEVTEEELHTCQHVLVHTQKQLAELQEENEALRSQLQASVAQPAATTAVRAADPKTKGACPGALTRLPSPVLCGEQGARVAAEPPVVRLGVGPSGLLGTMTPGASSGTVRLVPRSSPRPLCCYVDSPLWQHTHT